jgi:hypothetical protein
MIADAVSRCIPDTTERPDAIRFLELLEGEPGDPEDAEAA